MNVDEAIQQLDEMQSQIIHGKRIFGDIADCIRELVANAKRGAELYEQANGVPCTCYIDDSTCGHCGKITYARARLQKAVGDYYQE